MITNYCKLTKKQPAPAEKLATPLGMNMLKTLFQKMKTTPLCLSTLNIKNKALLESRHYNGQHGKIQTDDEEIAKLLNYQFASVFPQDDGSSPLKELEEVANPLVLIFNASLIERIPSDWKHATITPLYKGENTRSISTAIALEEIEMDPTLP